mmetsp:Transcript_12738/g.19711  ORF Transcript_12738/g.19711 Transcript_12738/m.19711 type:complete len:532 (+) Transcript_12738:98-1693(+)
MMSIFMKHRFLLASLLVLVMSTTDARKIRSSGLTSRHQHHHLHHIKSNALSPDLYKLRGGEVDIDSTTTAAAATHYQRTISTLHSTSFLIVLSTSIVAFTPLPSITRHLAASLSSSSTSSPQEQAVKILSLISAASAAVELFLSPLLGTLLDRFGRKRPSVLLHSLITLTNLGVVMYPSVHTICISRIINVLCSGFLIITTQSIIGDLFSGNQKDNNNGHGKDQMGAVLGRQAALISSGFLFGSLLGGRLTEYGERIAYSVAAIFSALAALNAAFRMTDTLDLTSSSSSSLPTTSVAAAADESKALDWTSLKKALLEAPLSSIQLLFHYGSHMRTLALLLLLQSAPMYMGDVFQVFAKEEWGLKPADFGKIVALFGVLGIVSNTTLSLIVKQMGLRTFSLFAIVSSLFFPMTAIFTNNYRNVLIAGSIGLYSGAQKVGTTTAITSLANERGIPQGQLQGEKASMLALLKIGCPVIYSALYLKGKEWSMSMNDAEGNKLALQMIMGKFGKKMPFVLNCILGVIAFIVTWQNM